MSKELDAYLARVGYAGPHEATHAVLDAVHQAHVHHIPFENLDIMLGRPIRVDIASVRAKLVDDKRGGYCFEQNTLLCASLRELGFEVDVLLARVCRSSGWRVPPEHVTGRTHMILLVHLHGERWICDAGFGSSSLMRPAPLRPGGEVVAGPWVHRIVPTDDGRQLMQWRPLNGTGGISGASDWEDLYVFTLEPQYPVDIEMSNHYVSTWPESRFVQTLTAQRIHPTRRVALRNRELSVDVGNGPVTRRLGSRDEVIAVLADELGLRLGADAPLRTPE